MFNDVVDNFLNRYSHCFEQNGYSLLSLNKSSSLSVLTMVSTDYFLSFSFFNELPCRLVVDIKSHNSTFKEQHKYDILNKELNFFPFNRHKHEKLDNAQKNVLTRFNLYNGEESFELSGKLYNECFYSIRVPTKIFDVEPAVSRLIGRQVFRINNYGIFVTKDGEIFYATKTYYSLTEGLKSCIFTFNSNDDLYEHDGHHYRESDLEVVFFDILINKINDKIFKDTDITLINQPEPIIKKAIELYKMINI